MPTRPFPPQLTGGPGEGGPHPRPTRRVVALLDAPLEVDVEYQMDVTAVTNINGIGGGGGDDVTLMLESPRPVAADSLGAGGVPAGGGAARPAPAPPVAPDTTRLGG